MKRIITPEQIDKTEKLIESLRVKVNHFADLRMIEGQKWDSEVSDLDKTAREVLSLLNSLPTWFMKESEFDGSIYIRQGKLFKGLEVMWEDLTGEQRQVNTMPEYEGLIQDFNKKLNEQITEGI